MTVPITGETRPAPRGLHPLPPLAEVDLVGLMCTIAELGNDTASPPDLLRRTIDVVSQHIGWPVGSIWLIDPAGGLIPAGTDPIGPINTFAAASLPPAGRRGLPGRVAESGRPAWITDIHDDHDFPRLAAASAAGLRTAFAVPVMAGATMVAVLEFFTHEKVPHNAQLTRVMAAIGVQLGRTFERDAALREAKTAADDARQILNSARDAFVAIDSDGVITGWNTQAEAIFGWASTEAIGRRMSELIIPDTDRADHEAGMRRFLATGRATAMGRRIELEGLRRNGELFPLEISFWTLHTRRGWGFYSFCRDITERKTREAELTRRALHDELTGLANRRLAVEHINRALARRARHGPDFAVLFLDLDRFKVVNDSLGHHMGDQLLQIVAQRVSSAVRPTDTVARIAGDEFAIICDELGSPDDATRLSDRILRSLSRPVNLAGDRIRIGASIGIALAGSVGDTAEGLLRDADIAMYWAKQHGRGRAAVFEKALRGQLHNALRTEQEPSVTVTGKQLRWRHQPVVDLAGGHEPAA